VCEELRCSAAEALEFASAGNEAGLWLAREEDARGVKERGRARETGRLGKSWVWASQMRLRSSGRTGFASGRRRVRVRSEKIKVRCF